MPLLQCYNCDNVLPEQAPGALQCAGCGSEFVALIETPAAAQQPLHTGSARTPTNEAVRAHREAVQAQQAAERHEIRQQPDTAQFDAPQTAGQQTPGLQGMLTNLLSSILPSALTGRTTEGQQQHQQQQQPVPPQGFSFGQLFTGQPNQHSQQQQQQRQAAPPGAPPRDAAEQYNAQTNPPPFNEFFSQVFNFDFTNQAETPTTSFTRTAQGPGGSTVTVSWGSEVHTHSHSPNSFFSSYGPAAATDQGHNTADGHHSVHAHTHSFVFGPGVPSQDAQHSQGFTNIPDLATFMAQALQATIAEHGASFGDFASGEMFDNIISDMMNANPQSNVYPSSETTMQALRREKWQGKESHSDIIVDEDCSICQDAYKLEETLVVLNCKHAYHEECCLMWLKTNGVCPICRAPVKGGDGQAASAPAPSAPASTRQEPSDRNEQGAQSEAQFEMPQEPRSLFPQFIFPFVNTLGQNGSPAPIIQRQDFLPEDELD